MDKIGGKIFLLALPFIAIQLGASFSLEAGIYNAALFMTNNISFASVFYTLG